MRVLFLMSVLCLSGCITPSGYYPLAPLEPISDGIPIYNSSQCIGAVVNGVCNGSVMPDASYHPVCHGDFLNGMCTGPMF